VGALGEGAGTRCRRGGDSRAWVLVGESPWTRRRHQPSCTQRLAQLRHREIWMGGDAAELLMVRERGG
jgi:hypothetical protein